MGVGTGDRVPGRRQRVGDQGLDVARYQGRIDWDLKKEGRLSLFAIGSSDTLHVFQKDPDANSSANLDTAVKFFRVIGTETVLAYVLQAPGLPQVHEPPVPPPVAAPAEPRLQTVVARPSGRRPGRNARRSGRWQRG